MNTMDEPPDTNQEVNVDNVLYSPLNKSKELSDELPPLDIVREMIKYETFLRLSEPIQQLFDLYHKDDNAIT